MPALAIIPAAAIRDAQLSDTQLRVLCALGIYTNKLGGSVWASIDRLSADTNVSSRTIQRSIGALVALGYVRKTERTGRTNLYEVVLDPVASPDRGGCHQDDVGGVTPRCHPNHEENHEAYPIAKAQDGKEAQAVTKAILEVFPKRPEPSPFPAVLRAVREALKSGASAEQLVQAAQEYATFVERHVPDRTFVRSPVRFYSYGYWREYQPIPRIYGRTREEWARSGQDVAEFDRLIASLAPALLSTVATQER